LVCNFQVFEIAFSSDVHPMALPSFAILPFISLTMNDDQKALKIGIKSI